MSNVSDVLNAPKKKGKRLISQVSLDRVRKQLFNESNISEHLIEVNELGDIAMPVNDHNGNLESSNIESEDQTYLAPKSKRFKNLELGDNIDGVTTDMCPLTLAKGLSKPQLLDLLSKLSLDPEVKHNMSQLLPKPNIEDLMTELAYFHHNIFKAMPFTRMSDRSDSLSYNRVSIHLQEFKKKLVLDVNMLSEAGQWESLVEYMIQAWDFVYHTPNWENIIHNHDRISCFKHLAGAIVRAVNEHKYVINMDKKLILISKMADLTVREVQLCRALLEKQ